MLKIVQSYFMGCAFDIYSPSWNHRTYMWMLFVLAWFIPVVVIGVSYIGIIYRVRKSNIQFLSEFNTRNQNKIKNTAKAQHSSASIGKTCHNMKNASPDVKKRVS